MLPLLVALLVQDKVQNLVDRLGSENIEVRVGAAKSLQELGATALPALRAAVRDRRGEVPARAATVVRAIEVRLLLPPSLKRLYPDLEMLLSKGETFVWRSILLDLRHDPDPELDALPLRDRGLVYEKALQEAEDDGYREDVLKTIEDRPAPMDATGVIALLGSANAEIRQLAARALGGMNSPAAVGPLRKSLEDREGEVRYHAARALGRLKAKEAWTDLQSMLSHPVPESTAAARSLGQIGAKEAEPALRAMLKEPGYPRLAAAQALADLDVEGGLLELGRILAEEEYYLQAEAADHFATLGKKGLPALKSCLQGPHPQGRALAVAALGKVGAAEEVVDAAALLSDPDPKVREAAVVALAALDARDQSEGILRLLSDKEWNVRAAAAGVLGRFQTQAAAPALRGLLKDEAPYVRIDAAEALCRLGDEAGVQVLLEESRSRHRLVQQVIPLSALNALRDRAAWTRLAGVPVVGVLEGHTLGMLSRLGEAGRLTVKSTNEDSEDDSADKPWRKQWRVIGTGRRVSVLDALLSMRGAYDVILEGDTLRVVTHAEALAFWAAWWAERSGKE